MKKYMAHTIRRTKCTTNGSRMVFGRPHPAVLDIYIIDGPIVGVGIAARLTTLSSCREHIRSAMGADLVSECQHAGDPHGGKWRVHVYDPTGMMWSDECSPHFPTKKEALAHIRNN